MRWSRAFCRSASGKASQSTRACERLSMAAPSLRVQTSVLVPERSSNSMGGLLESGFERSKAEPADGIDKALVRLARLDIDIDDAFDRIGHVLGGKAWAQNLADGRVLGCVATERDLVGFDAALLQAENADMADMVVAAGIDAAGDLDVQLSDLALTRGIREAMLDGLGDRDRARCRQRAIIEPGAGDDVGDHPDIGGGQARFAEFLPDRKEIALAQMRQDEVLRMGDAQFVMRILLGQVGDEPHLLRGRVARRLAYRLQRNGQRCIA